jgi:hypothetical protein
MRHNLLAMMRTVAVAAGAVVFVATASIAGQAPPAASKAPPATSKAWATAWGDPDLQGTYTNNRGVPLENPTNLAKLGKVPEPDRFENYNSFWGDGRKRSTQTSLVVDPPDGVLPLRPEVRAAANAMIVTKRSKTYVTPHWEDRDSIERCISRGMPGAMMGGFYNHNYQILQTPGYVAILIEMIHDARIIPLDGRPALPQGIGQWLGDSRGHWEGKTLVVETDHFNGKVRVANQALTFGLTASGRVTERFTRVDADTIDYRYTVNDPAYFTQPFTVSDSLERIPSPIYEFACHEGNYALQDILAGARATEKAAADKAGKK